VRLLVLLLLAVVLATGLSAAAPGLTAPAAAHPEPGDADGDGIGDPYDRCRTVADTEQRNSDQGRPGGDLLGDACDDDDDADGVPDAVDRCRVVPDPGQEDADGDGIGDACAVDTDGDGMLDPRDVCPRTADPGQEDHDRDGTGDPCDLDDDADGVFDAADRCPLAYDPAPLDRDRDRDGRGQACDPDDGRVPEALRVTLDAGRVHTRAQLGGGLVAGVRCSAACRVSARVTLTPAAARRLRLDRRLLGTASARLAGAGRTFAFVGLRTAALRRIPRGARVGAVLRVTATDGSRTRRLQRRLVLAG
jgi:hypothetical protein